MPALFLLVALALPAPSFAIDSDDSQVFISGFNAYQRKDYQSAIHSMSDLLKKYPDTPLRDMGLFWLARSHYKAGNKQEAAKYMSQFLKEYPDSPLKGTVEEELLTLADRYQKGLPLEEVAKAQKSPEQIAAEKAAAEKALAEKAAAVKAAAEKAAAERAAAERAAAEKAAAERVAAEKAAAEKAAAQRAAEEKAAAERAAAEKAAAEKAAAEHAAAVQAAAEKAAVRRAAEEKAAADKAAAEKAAAEAAAADKAVAETAAAEKAAAAAVAAEKAAAEKAAADKVAAEKAAAAKVAAEKATAEKAAAARLAQAAPKTKKGRKESKKAAAAMRANAVAAYKEVIDKYPGTTAAVTAKAKLKALGVEYPEVAKPAPAVAAAPAAPAAAPAAGQAGTSQVLNLEIAQFSDMDVQVGPIPEMEEAGKRFTIPVEVTNLGNGTDSFYLESGFPPEYDVHFAAAANPDVPINATPNLSPGDKFRGNMVGTVPRANIDGQKNSFPIKVVSNLNRDASQSREIKLVTSAPLLRAVVKTDKTKLLPGEKIAYRVDLLNIGSAPARGVTVRLNYPPEYEPVDYLPAGFKIENRAAMVLDGMQLKSGESTVLNVTFQLKEEALAQQELFVRADVINNDLDKKDSFLSATSVVQSVSSVTAKTTADKLVVIPGQVVSVPLIVTNTGNMRQLYSIRSEIPRNVTFTFFQDLNRDGKKQPNEPIINHVGPLTPKEESYVVLEIATPASENDGASTPVSVVFEPENSEGRAAVVGLQLIYSRPVLEMTMAARGGRLKPGEVSSLEINCVNRGSNLAKSVVMTSVFPAQLELLAADPSFAVSNDGKFSWRFDELGSGERRSIKVSYRVKPGIAVGTNLQMKNSLSYQDLLGNRY
ncbi:tetratricopeptide repeat protein [Geomonas sp. Red875]|uniref:Tetratricopeptide repeat protein n=2 Tax=Geomesophilobacter sediminis TaxID=2798584 RepID=A0A8J7M0U0_9BACT|nr:tetratricopeptide repeat protein [Geomesophilobacter sediminis]MBJ6726522.1 tetratricopeptide repeat protein [Geomesophilobacter sediminis]